MIPDHASETRSKSRAVRSEVSRLTSLRTARLFDRVSLAWSGIIALLAAETPHARSAAYEAFYALEPEEQKDMLDYLDVPAVEEAHPRIV